MRSQTGTTSPVISNPLLETPASIHSRPSPTRLDSFLPEGRTEKKVSVLAVSSDEVDHLSLQSMFAATNWKLHSARTMDEALKLVQTGDCQVVIADRDFHGGTWSDFLEAYSGVEERRPYIIVASHQADNQLWAKVLNLGGYDVLEKPLDKREVIRTVSLAWLQWKHRLDKPKADCRIRAAAG